MDKEIKQELDALMATAEIRSIPDKINKAVKILFDYCGELDIKKYHLEQYFEINNKTLQRRVWSMFLGYNEHTKDKPRYLAPVWEEYLADLMDFSKKNLQTIGMEELKELV
jgi:hypothetical protein